MAIIKRNFALKLLAVALAIVGWAYFRFATNPLLAARFDQQLSVPITTINLPVDLVAHFNDRDAVVTVEAPRGQPPVKPDEIKAVLDLSGKATGVYNVPVALVAPNVVVQSLSPASVALTIERIDLKSFALELHYMGTQSGIVVGNVVLAPTNATVRGADSLLGQVTSLRLEIPLPTQPTSLDEMMRPVPVNSLGEEVTGVQVSPELVRVQVQFVQGQKHP
jgi:YbbR domain-containing protein